VADASVRAGEAFVEEQKASVVFVDRGMGALLPGEVVIVWDKA